MQITKLATYENGVSQKDALALAKENGMQLLNLLAIEKIIRCRKLYKEFGDCISCWTSIHMKYSGTDCVATDLSTGEVMDCKIPEEDGWYKTNKMGLPFGEPSNSEDKTARYLWRVSSYSGLVSRYGYSGFGVDCRYVGCGGGDCRFGVLATSRSIHRKDEGVGCARCRELEMENKTLKAKLHGIDKIMCGVD